DRLRVLVLADVGEDQVPDLVMDAVPEIRTGRQFDRERRARRALIEELAGRVQGLVLPTRLARVEAAHVLEAFDLPDAAQLALGDVAPILAERAVLFLAARADHYVSGGRGGDGV